MTGSGPSASLDSFRLVRASQPERSCDAFLDLVAPSAAGEPWETPSLASYASGVQERSSVRPSKAGLPETSTE